MSAFLDRDLMAEQTLIHIFHALIFWKLSKSILEELHPPATHPKAVISSGPHA